MRKIWSSLFFLLAACAGLHADQHDITGYWNSIDDKTHKARSVVAIYEYDNKYYGRLVGAYNDEGTAVEQTIDKPISHATGVVGDPYYCGIDFIWNLRRKGNGFEGGKIMDPSNGNIYGCEMWRKGNDLILRGKFLIFGKNITWTRTDPAVFPDGFKTPNPKTFVPKIPKAK